MKKYQNFLSENFPFLVVKFSIYLNRPVFVMCLVFNPILDDGYAFLFNSFAAIGDDNRRLQTA